MTRNAARKKRIRARADRDNVGYREATRLPGHLIHRSAPAAPSRDDLLRRRVDRWCAEQHSVLIEDIPGDVVVELDLHDDLEDAAVHELDPDLSTLTMKVDEVYLAGQTSVKGTVRARLVVEGVMPLPEAGWAEEEGVVAVLGERSKHYLEVVDENEVTVDIEFAAVVEHRSGEVQDFDAGLLFVTA